jgi:hypothetical protein
MAPPFGVVLPGSRQGNRHWYRPDPVGKNRSTSNEEVDMGFKTGVLVGFGVGYVLGSKAGRERYEELRAAWDQFTGNPSVQRVVTKGREVVDTGVRKGVRAVEDRSEDIKTRLEGSSGTTGASTSTTTTP